MPKIEAMAQIHGPIKRLKVELPPYRVNIITIVEMKNAIVDMNVASCIPSSYPAI